MSSVPEGLYPLATSKGDPIPLDVARPKGLVIVDVAPTESKTITLPSAQNLVHILCSANTQLTLGDTAPDLQSNTYYPDVMMLIAGVAYDLVIPSVVTFTGVGAASRAFCNVMETWLQLQNPTKFMVS